jgi:enolase-phosphatase E1
LPLPAGVGAVVTDLEGTTTAVAFVYEVLFPHAAARLGEYVARGSADPEVSEALRLLRHEHEAARAAGEAGLPDFGDGMPYARHLMALDRKSTGLKRLQGLIWRDGYRDGALKGEVFPDVPPALAAWRGAGIRLRVFSSGSVLAQKLLLSTTRYGDLTPCFEGFHDTTTGPKVEPSSYRAIAAAFALPPPEILFLSDLPAELDAALEAGLQTGLLERPGNRPAGDGSAYGGRYRSFAELV